MLDKKTRFLYFKQSANHQSQNFCALRPFASLRETKKPSRKFLMAFLLLQKLKNKSYFTIILPFIT